MQYIKPQTQKEKMIEWLIGFFVFLVLIAIASFFENPLNNVLLYLITLLIVSLEILGFQYVIRHMRRNQHHSNSHTRKLTASSFTDKYVQELLGALAVFSILQFVFNQDYQRSTMLLLTILVLALKDLAYYVYATEIKGLIKKADV